MPLDMQVKLLRVLEEKKIERVGGQGRIDVDVRVIAATNQDITQEVRKGRFRRDLFYRLNVFRIKLPPLRERKEDVPYLVDHFVAQLSATMNKKVKKVAPGFYHRLMDYDWPGNIRELKNAVHQAMAIMDKENLTEKFLDSFFRQVDRTQDLVTTPNFNKKLFEIEREAIRKTLNFTRGNKRETAKILGIGRATLHRKLKTYEA
jgi:two-component system response regulator HydG